MALRLRQIHKGRNESVTALIEPGSSHTKPKRDTDKYEVMTKEKITLQFDELHTAEVEERVRQQEALNLAQASSQRMAAAPSRLPVPERGSIWYNTFFNLTVFGLLGGLLAWGCGELVQYLNPDLHAEAKQLTSEIKKTYLAWEKGNINNDVTQSIIKRIEYNGRDNPWFRVENDKSLTPAQRSARREELLKHDRLQTLFGNICFYSACGVLIALALGMAESVAARNLQGAVVYGGVGALLGLVGGVVVSLFVERLYHFVGGGQTEEVSSMGRQILARSLSWAVLGLFLSAAPGVVMRNGRKLAYGLIGGFIGGAIGGVLFDPVGKITGSPVLSRLIAIVAIGAITGIGTALVENAAKQGWLKVIKGLIAGKQFIVYRNPTFIGTSPQCESYLFKDMQVGRRHAALHIGPAGYDIEDLGTGSGTFINGRPVDRSRLRNGDQVQVGATCFTFQEKERN
jgi:hypothetical protein